MEILVPSSWTWLVNLEEIIVAGCEKMEEIIGGTRSDEEGDMGEESSNNNTEFKLPKLRFLALIRLPKLWSGFTNIFLGYDNCSYWVDVQEKGQQRSVIELDIVRHEIPSFSANKQKLKG
jgi:hypothetical protein